jgi:hypothetical protein
MRRLSLFKVLLIVCAFAGIGGALFAQEMRRPISDSAQDALLAEVRALRSEINQMASVGIRSQLLVARLQLQEQRVLTAGRHLVETQDALAALRLEIAGEQARVDQLEKSMSRSTAQGQAQIQQAILAAKAQIEQQKNRQQELQARETDLLHSLNNEQSRWTDFNDRLDALQRSLPPGVR